jgi:phosphonate transport system substrate-binding protein
MPFAPSGHAPRPTALIVVTLLLIALLLAPLAAAADKGKRLVFGVHPYLPADELHDRFQPLVRYLSQQTGIQFELRIARNYETHIENVGNHVVDIAYMGPASYVDLTRKYGKTRLLARLEVNGRPYFHGYIVTRHDQSLRNLRDLKGKRFAFGSPHSTMSYIVPRHMLRDKGIRLEDLAGYKFLGNHRNVALGVLLGEYHAGAVKEEVYHEFRDRGLKKLAISPPISEHIFVCRNGLPADQYELLRNTLLSLSASDDGHRALSSIKATITGLVPAHYEDYDNLRSLMN